MKVKQLVVEVKKKYPDNDVFVTNENSFQEIICEIDPSSTHPKRSTALAIVGKSIPHKHKFTTEVYRVIKGRLTLFIDGKKFVLNKGDSKKIAPEKIHYAQGKEVWFYTYSTPGWSPTDHFTVNIGD
jgi:mannose-6-phosphate isomerase-like protein (cupin superfamily)